MQQAQLSVELTPAERRDLCRVLARHLELDELKDLAFDLGTDNSVFHQDSRRTFCRELVACHERRDQVRCLAAAVLERTPKERDALATLVSRLPACEPWAKLQVTPDEGEAEIGAILDALAAQGGITPGKAALVSAVRAPVRLLIGVPHEVAETVAGETFVPFAALEALHRHAWRWVAQTWPPVVAGGALRPVASWDEALDAVRANLMREGIEAIETGQSLAQAGEYERAIASMERAAEIARELGDAEMEAAVLGHLGNARYREGRVDGAITYYRQALEVARELGRETGDRRTESIHLGNVGVAYSAQGQTQAAIAYYQQALSIARQARDLRTEGNLLGNLGLAYSALTSAHQASAAAHSRAVDYYQQALAIAREVSYRAGDRQTEGTLLCYLGDAYRGMGQAPGTSAALRRANLYTAADTYHRALAIAREAGNKRIEGDLLGRLGNTYLSLGELGDGQYRTAIEYYQQAVQFARKSGDRKSEGVRLGNLGSTFYALGQTEQALDTFQKALAIAREIGDRRGEGIRLGNLGNAYFARADIRRDGAVCGLETGLGTGTAANAVATPGAGPAREIAREGEGDLQSAAEAYQQALDIARAVNDRYAEGVHLSHLGLVYCALGDLESASPLTDEAQGTDDAQRALPGTADELLSGDIPPDTEASGPKRHYRAAIEVFGQALDIAREIGDHKAEGFILGSLGDAYSSLGQVPGARPRDRRPAAARECYRQALAIAREIGDRRAEAHHLGHLGSVYHELGEREQAIAALEQALIIAREIGDRDAEASHLGSLGLAYSAFGQDGRARTYFQQAVSVAHDLGDLRCEGNWLGDLGSTYSATGQHEQAMRCYSRALEIARSLGDREDEATWLGNLGNAYVSLREVGQGIALYEEALVIAREIGNRREEGGLLGNMGNAYTVQHKWDQAAAAYTDALAVARKAGDRRGEGIWLLNLGLALDEQGDREGAIAQVTAARDALEAARSPEAAQAMETLEGWAKEESGK